MKTYPQHIHGRRSSHWLAHMLVLTTTLSAALLPGCSSGTSSTPTTAFVKTMNVPVLVTDAPSSQLLSFELTISSITLTDTAGKTVNVITNPERIEATHLNGTSEPLLTLALAQDTYTTAVIGYSNPEVTYLNPNGTNTVVEYSNTNSGTVTVNLATPITVSNVATSLSVDLLLAQSVTISGSTVTINPAFNVTSVPVTAQPTNDHNGKIEGVKGTIAALNTSTNNITVQSADGPALVVAVNSSTQFDGISGLSALGVGMLVEVDVATQSDGSLLATRIEIEDASTHDELEGPVVKVTGSPASSFGMVLRQELGGDLSTSNLGTVYSITVNNGTLFKTSNRFGEDQSFPFNAVFNASTIFAGQNVTVVAPTIAGTTATATIVRLQQQTVAGTVSAISTIGGYTVYKVTLAPTDFLTAFTGATSVMVYTNSNTQMVTSTALAVGSSARFHGLLFNPGGVLTMISGEAGDGEHQGSGD